MKSTPIFLLSAALFINVTATAQGAASTAPEDTVYTRPGQLVAAGDGARLNLYCMGNGPITVVFESGWGDWAPAWSIVQPRIAKWTRTCSYDRAGAGFSDPGPMPRTSVRIADDLHTALHNAGIAGPYILVGSAFGGGSVRTFADRYMREVAGLVLIDADASDLEPKAMQEEDHRGVPSFVSGMRKCRDAVAQSKPIPPSCSNRFFRGLPEAAWSSELNAKVLQFTQTNAAMYDAYASEMEQMAWDEAYLQKHRRSLGSRPIRVLTSGNHGVGHLEEAPAATPAQLNEEREITRAQARWRGLSSNAKQIFARHSSEYIQFDEPDTVTDAIREVYDQSK